jgi:LCP family protein required for cell wall assembly
MRPRRWGRIVRATLVAGLAVVLVAAGFIVYQLNDMDQGMASSHALAGAPKSTDGGTNILLMGLDTRKDQNGNQLPPQILDQLHAGDGEEGGYNTNTLILLHLPSGGGQVKAFSIPRDDAVDIPGYGEHKIKEAYGLAKADAETQLAKQGVTDQHQLETQSRDAGRKASLDAVRNLTGVSIDHFAEVSLAGFYDLANALGGVEVCLNGPVNDSAYSGAVFPAGKQSLNGAQALAFVRQRHGLPNGDLDRTHRQQAFLASASHNIRSLGTLIDPWKVQGLSDAAKSDVVIDDGWGVLSMAWELQSLPVATRNSKPCRSRVMARSTARTPT